jgi:DNA-binding transcriptional regulator/RsmH inhibitor MraZ
MERRDFLKRGFLTIFSIYGLSENTLCFAGEKIPPTHHAGTGRYPFTGVYFGTLTNERVMMPDVFSRLPAQGRFVLAVPERNSSALLIPENSPEWEIIKQLFDAADKDGPLILRECSEIDGEGNLYFPERVSKFAGIHTPAIAIIGHGYVIEIIDSERYHSHIV